MLELRFPPQHRIDDRHLAAVRQVIAEVLEIQRGTGNRAANQVLFDKIGLNIWDALDEGYCAEALEYHLGLLYAHIGEPEEAAAHMARSGTFAGAGGYRIFSDHQSVALELRRQQEAALQRGIPSLTIASMPRSASASLTQTLATALDIPIMRVSCGRYPNFYLIPRWLDEFSRGGAVLHDHFGALPYNLAALRKSGVRNVFVRVRDPRPAAASALRRRDRIVGAPHDADFESRMLSTCTESFIPWLEKWIISQEEDLRIHFLTQRPHSISNAAREILSILSSEYPMLEGYLRSGITDVVANFVTGDDDAWRETISESGQGCLWQSMSQGMKDLLELRR